MANEAFESGTDFFVSLNFDSLSDNEEVRALVKLCAPRSGPPVNLPAITAQFREVYARIPDAAAKERLIERFVVHGALTKKLLTGKRIVSGSSKVNAAGFWLECGDAVPSTSMTFARLSACLHFENGRLPPEKRKVPSMVVRIPWDAVRAVDNRIADVFKYFMGPGFAFIWRLLKDEPGYSATDNARFVVCCCLLDWQAHVNKYGVPSLTFKSFVKDSFIAERCTLQSLVRNNPTVETSTHLDDPLKTDRAGKRLLKALFNLDVKLLPQKGKKGRSKKCLSVVVREVCSAKVMERMKSVLSAS